MARKEDIIVLPHPSLRQPSQTVVFPLSEEIQQVIEDMKSATLDWEASRPHEFGVALAGVQINRLHRIVVVRQSFNDKANHGFDIYINPEIARVEGEPEADYEGCLSVADIYGHVPRYARVKVKAKNEHGVTVKLLAKGFMARVFQHEIDHTNGLTFVDRIGQKGEFFKLQPDGAMKPLERTDHSSLIKKLNIPQDGTAD